MKGFATIAVLTLACGAAMGQYQYSGASIGTPDGWAKFDTLKTGDSLDGYTEAGMVVDTNWTEYQWQPLGFDASGCYYQNGGYSGQTYISQVGGADFNAVEFQVSDGWYKNDIFAWVQVYNNGSQVASYDYNVNAGTVIGVGGGGFDEIRVQAYYDAASRDAHSPSSYGALAIDNLKYAAVPAPGALALLGAGGLIAGRRRRV